MSRPIQHQCQEFPNPRNSHLIQQPGRSKICYFAQMDFDLRKICYDHEDIESLSKGTDAKILLRVKPNSLIHLSLTILKHSCVALAAFMLKKCWPIRVIHSQMFFCFEKKYIRGICLCLCRVIFGLLGVQ